MDKILDLSFPVLLVLAVPLIFLTWRNGSFLQKQTGSEVVFRRRRSYRAFLLCMSLLSAVGIPAVNFGVDQTTAKVITVIWVGLGLGLLCCCLPEELRFNLDKRTWQLTKGWPPFARIRSGTWNDISGIYIYNIRSVYMICLGYKHPAGDWTLIGIQGRHSGAVSLARDLATRLDLPTINPPTGR